MLVVTHDRWFLDAVCTTTWEVADGAVHQYEGGYAAYVLARAERDRQAAAREDRRQQLLRKELAWLRRGPPARTSKPKFRIEAANALIADEPEPRDRAELLRFATARLGDKVLDAERRRRRLRRAAGCCATLTWRLGPGRPRRARRRQRLGQDDAAASCSPASWSRRGHGRARRDRPARPPLPGHGRDPRATCACSSRSRRSRGRAALSDGRELTAGHAVRPLRLPRRAGAHARARPLRRRAPAAAAHAAADGRAQRAAARRADQRPRHRHADRARGPARRLARHARRRQPRPLLRRARLRRRLRAHRRRRHPPPARRDRAVPRAAARRRGAAAPPPPARRGARAPPGAVVRAARKEVARLERALDKLGDREAALHEEMAASATDHARLRELQARARARRAAERERLEAAWLEHAAAAEGSARGPSPPRATSRRCARAARCPASSRPTTTASTSLKFRGAGQGPKALVAELIAGELARALGLPVPELVLVELDPALGRAEPDPEIQELIAAQRRAQPRRGLPARRAALRPGRRRRPRAAPPPSSGSTRWSPTSTARRATRTCWSGTGGCG